MILINIIQKNIKNIFINDDNSWCELQIIISSILKSWTIVDVKFNIDLNDKNYLKQVKKQFKQITWNINIDF